MKDPEWLKWGVSVTVTEEVTRRCCDPKRDFKQTQGWWGMEYSPSPRIHFCTHCGRHWREVYTANENFPHFSGSPYVPSWEPLLFHGESDRPAAIRKGLESRKAVPAVGQDVESRQG